MMEERRRFYRIDDSVILNYQAFPESQIDEVTARLKMLGSQHKLLRNSLGSLELRLDFLLDEISEALPEIAEALTIINRKLSILSSLDNLNTDSTLGLNSGSEGESTREINLSGSGIAFSSPTEFPHGETMEIEFVLFPDYYNIKAIGRIVDCRESNKEEPEMKYELAVDFIYLKEVDRDYIISHVLRKQSEELKEIRESAELLETAGLDALV